jgi:hypothetical protein
MSDNVKTYKNRKRSHPEKYKPYVPQYVVHGVEPSEYKSAVVPENTRVAVPKEAANRTRKVGIRQPYAASVPSPVGRGRGPIPNVGNNVEHTWSSVDGDIVDDLSGQLDPNHPMVDNNDFVTPGALGLSPEEYNMTNQVQNPPIQFDTTAANHEDLFPIVRDLEDSAYLLIVDGVPVCSGPKEEIEEQARALVFGEHEMCDGTPIPSDDIIIIKRVPVKIGLFLE